MNKRQFLKTVSLAALTASKWGISPSFAQEDTNLHRGHRAWIHPSKDESNEILQARYKSYREAGITVIYIEGGSEIHARIAKENGIQAHYWGWTLLKNDAALMKSRPEWYAVNRNGKSTTTHPAYVDYYRWLCPSREDIHEFLELEARKQLAKEEVDGYHLDYIRYCDVILPVNLWDKYKIVQTSELPEYDYCYCEVCQEKFEEQFGINPLKLEYPDQSPSWRAFRYDNITRLVNRIANVAKEFSKPLTAAVFPTPEIAQRLVRQDWLNWNLSAVNPMIYHEFYRENVEWIGQAVKEGVNSLNNRLPLFAGLYLPDFKTEEELRKAIVLSLRNGASGVTIFSNPNENILRVLQQATLEAKS